MDLAMSLELEEAIREAARHRGVPPEVLAAEALRDRFLAPDAEFLPRDDWERRLLSIGTDCGGSLPPSAWTSEEMYD